MAELRIVLGRNKNNDDDDDDNDDDDIIIIINNNNNNKEQGNDVVWFSITKWRRIVIFTRVARRQA